MQLIIMEMEKQQSGGVMEWGAVLITLFRSLTACG